MIKNEKARFNKLFGISQDELGEVLLISPFFNSKLFASQVKNPRSFKGMVFYGVNGTYKNKKVTFIHTGMGQSLVADCVQAQNSKSVKAIIFLGAVGAVRDLGIADNVLIEKAFFDTEYYDKFGIRLGSGPRNNFSPDQELVSLSVNTVKDDELVLKKANVISMHTFLDQGSKRAEKFSKNKIQSVDLECALFYAAACMKKIKAIAFCFVSDNILTKPFWGEFSSSEYAEIKAQMPKLIKFALNLSVDILKK